MAGMQFEYDAEGGTFFYFLLSFWALLLIPATYFLWPSKQNIGAPFTNGYVVYVIHEEAYNLPNATRSLLIVLSRKGYHAVYKSLYTKVYSLYNTMCGFKKNINRNWQRIKAYLECMFLLPMQGRKKINSFTALAENTTVKENVPVLTVLKTDCVKCPVLRKSFRDTATLLKAKLTESRTKLKHSLNCDMKHLNQSLKRKDAIISKLKTQRRLLRKENLILRKKINSDDIKNINKMQQMELSLKEITADYMQLMQDKDRQIIALQQQISDLQCQLDSFKVKDLKCDLVLKSKTKKQYNTPMRKCIFTCLLNHVPVQRTGHVIETVVKELTQMRLDEIPGPTTIAQMAYEISVISDLQVAEQLYEASEAVATLSWDSTTIDGCHINEFHISINGESLTLNINKLSSGRTEDYFEHIKNTIQDLAETYSTFSNIHQHLIMYKFREAFNTTLSDRARVNHCINSCLSELLGKELVELKCNLHPLDGLASEARKVLKKIDEEKSIISNIHGTEGCAANLVYRISKLRYSDKCGDPGGLKTYLKEHGLKIGIIPRYVGNRFNILFHMAGVIYQMKDILCSFLDKYCTANIRLHIKEDLEKPEILTQLRVLGSDDKKRKCKCAPCITKTSTLTKEKASVKPVVIKFILIIGWIIFILLAWKVSMIQLDYSEYDPYEELQIDRGAEVAEIKKAYRKLSKIYHPDRDTGDPKKFMRIAKAYAALTDEESRKNWEEFGNPDGPEATRFGIALPKWIVERENSMWVLAVYGLVFMIILPIVVGVWWYHSIKFSGDQVLLETSRIYYFFISRTPNMILKRAVEVLGSSGEFDRMHNAEIIERPTDNEELPALIKQLQNVKEKNRERSYCIKTRALILAHFQRLPLNKDTLAVDQKYILKKCPYLINEMVHTAANLVAMAINSGRDNQSPRLESIENFMKMSQMVVQALDEKSSPLQQLPHITPEMLRHFTTRKRDIRHIRDFVNMKDEDRRLMLRNLTDNEYLDVMTVCAQMPYVEMSVKTEVLDEEDRTITAGSIVTVTVKLVRKDMGEMFENQIPLATLEDDDTVENVENEKDEENDEKDDDDKQFASQDQSGQGDQTVKEDGKSKVWDKNKKAKKKGGKVKKKTKQVYQWKAVAQAKAETANAAAGTKATTDSDSPKASKPTKADKKEKNAGVEGDDVSEDENNDTEEEEDERPDAAPEKTKNKKEDNDDEEDDWDNYKLESKKENSLDTKIKESHPVHSPYFPEVKQEAWWVYVADRKRHLLITVPVHVCSLKKEEEIELKFSAPAKPGHYQYVVHLRSDSYYADFDQSQIIKLDVHEAKVIKDHPQWDISEDEDEKDKDNDDDSEEDDSDYSSESNESE